MRRLIVVLSYHAYSIVCVQAVEAFHPHEKIHFEDWSDNKVLDMKHEVVAEDAANIIDELKKISIRTKY